MLASRVATELAATLTATAVVLGHTGWSRRMGVARGVAAVELHVSP